MFKIILSLLLCLIIKFKVQSEFKQSADCGLSRKPYLKSLDFLRVIGGTDARRGEFPWIVSQLCYNRFN